MGFLWGRRRPSAAHAAVVQGLQALARAGRFAARPDWLVAELAGLPYSADLEGSWPGIPASHGWPSEPLAHPGGGRVAAKAAVLGVGHDAVVGAAGAGAAGAGAVAAEHLG